MRRVIDNPKKAPYAYNRPGVKVSEGVPSVTVLTEDGRRLSFRVLDRKDVTGLGVGDMVEITRTPALVC